MKTIEEVLTEVEAADWRLYFLKEFKPGDVHSDGQRWCASLQRDGQTTAFHRSDSPAQAIANALHEATSVAPEPEPEPETAEEPTKAPAAAGVFD